MAAPPKRGYAAIAPMRGPAPVAPMQAHVGVAVMTPRGTERPPPAKKVKFNGDGTVMYSKPKATPAFVRKE